MISYDWLGVKELLLLLAGARRLTGRHFDLPPGAFDGPSQSSLRTRLPQKPAGEPAEKVIPISSLQPAGFLTKLCRRLHLERV